MDKYRRVEKPKPQDETINENEIRITTQGKMRNYISYASSLFQVKYLSDLDSILFFNGLEGEERKDCDFKGNGQSN